MHRQVPERSRLLGMGRKVLRQDGSSRTGNRGRASRDEASVPVRPGGRRFVEDLQDPHQGGFERRVGGLHVVHERHDAVEVVPAGRVSLPEDARPPTGNDGPPFRSPDGRRSTAHPSPRAPFDGGRSSRGRGPPSRTRPVPVDALQQTWSAPALVGQVGPKAEREGAGLGELPGFVAASGREIRHDVDVGIVPQLTPRRRAEQDEAAAMLARVRGKVRGEGLHRRLHVHDLRVPAVGQRRIGHAASYRIAPAHATGRGCVRAAYRGKPIPVNATPPIQALVVAHESAEMLPACLGALAANGVAALVVDNASRDGSAAVAEGAGATVIRNGRNEGYGRANNRGAQAASTEWLIIVNPDVSLDPGAVAHLVEAAARYPRCGPLRAAHHRALRPPFLPDALGPVALSAQPARHPAAAGGRLLRAVPVGRLPDDPPRAVPGARRVRRAHLPVLRGRRPVPAGRRGRARARPCAGREGRATPAADPARQRRDASMPRAGIRPGRGPMWHANGACRARLGA